MGESGKNESVELVCLHVEASQLKTLKQFKQSNLEAH